MMYVIYRALDVFHEPRSSGGNAANHSASVPGGYRLDQLHGQLALALGCAAAANDAADEHVVCPWRISTEKEVAGRQVMKGNLREKKPARRGHGTAARAYEHAEKLH
jgi:hypothetical protein